MNDIIIFDLDDTLTESKSDIDNEMSKLLYRLLFKYKVGIISGCSYDQFQKQFLKPFWGHLLGDYSVLVSDVIKKIFLMPASGSQLYFYQNKWECVYKDSLPLKHKVKIFNIFYEACKNINILPLDNPYGNIAEDRDSQITFSFLGQKAPLAVKKNWDPDQSKRLQVVKEMQKIFHARGEGEVFEMTVGGSSSIDVTLKGKDKSYGIKKFIEWNNKKFDEQISITDIIFVADAIFPGGNDYSLKLAGANCIQVANIYETKKFLRTKIGDNDATV